MCVYLFTNQDNYAVTFGKLDFDSELLYVLFDITQRHLFKNSRTPPQFVSIYAFSYYIPTDLTLKWISNGACQRS